jgi:hypothetical protein
MGSLSWVTSREIRVSEFAGGPLATEWTKATSDSLCLETGVMKKLNFPPGLGALCSTPGPRTSLGSFSLSGTTSSGMSLVNAPSLFETRARNKIRRRTQVAKLFL